MKKKIAVCIVCMLMAAGFTLNVFAESASVSGRFDGYRYSGTMTLTTGRIYMNMSASPLSGTPITIATIVVEGTAFTTDETRIRVYDLDTSSAYYCEDEKNAPTGEVFYHSIGSFYLDGEIVASRELFI